MNPYLEPPGFLGTGASLLADVTLLAYLLLIIPSMILGFVFARRKLHRPHHKRAMIFVTVINWILIIFLMFTAYRFDVAPNIGANPDNTRYLLPVIHGLLGIPAQLLATFIVLRMIREDTNVARAKRRGEKDTSRYWFKSAKPFMRVTLTLWLITAALGVVSYLTRYNVIPTIDLGGNAVAPLATDEIAPIETSEADALGTETPEAPIATDEITSTETLEADTSRTETPEAPIATDEIPPIETVEADIAVTETLAAPIATDEIAPVQSQEVTPPAATPEVPVGTPEVEAPVETPEVESDAEFRVEGTLEAVGSIAVIVDGQRYDISNARIDDVLRVGAQVRMEVHRINGQLVVERIRIEDDGGDDD